MSSILCIIDGMTDAGFDASAYPALSSMRLSGYVKTTPDGYDSESLNCILTLLGVKDIPRNLRGYAEALGAGVPVQQDDLIFRLSWFSLVCDRCVLPWEAPLRIDPCPGMEYHSLGGYKSLLVLPGQADTIENIRTEPPYRCAGQAAASFRPSGNKGLEAFFSRQLDQGVCAIPWGQSRGVALPPFPAKAAVICGTGIVRGIARLLGMKTIDAAGATGDTDTGIPAKVAAAIRAAQDHPFVLLHLNGADEAAHRRDASGKQRFLKKVDSEALRPLLATQHAITVTSDHGTDSMTGAHICALQPVFVKC